MVFSPVLLRKQTARMHKLATSRTNFSSTSSARQLLLQYLLRPRAHRFVRIDERNDAQPILRQAIGLAREPSDFPCPEMVKSLESPNH